MRCGTPDNIPNLEIRIPTDPQKLNIFEKDLALVYVFLSPC